MLTDAALRQRPQVGQSQVSQGEEQQNGVEKMAGFEANRLHVQWPGPALFPQRRM